MQRLLPRMLSQACRDPNSPCHGCFDRNWWHYKIRDFPSIILQQGGYALWVASKLNMGAEDAAALGGLAAASARFWNRRATMRGAFEEYYPWEQGYPPLAFSTLAVMKLVAAGVVAEQDVRAGAEVAAYQLQNRFEQQAANQQVAGLAALAWIRNVFPALVGDKAFASLRERSLALQHAEGWYEEYGGPDLGYLSVTIDCLWDLWDATQDPAYLASAGKALRYIAHFAPLAHAGIGMHNARNTDYILPYGIARFVAEGTPEAALAASVLGHLYERTTSPAHFIHAIDDRYLCHYAGHSLLRCIQVLRGMKDDPVSQPLSPEQKLLPGSGHFLRPSTQSYSSLLSLKKGGILSLWHRHATAHDFGWVVIDGDLQHVTHWQSSHWISSGNGDAFTIAGHLVPTKEHLSSPFKHMLLRLAVFFLGRHVIAALKNKLIFQSKPSPCRFQRTVAFEANAVRVTDRITGVPAGATVVPAPRSSKRHVASADSHHAQDLALAVGVHVQRSQGVAGSAFTCETVYRTAPQDPAAQSEPR
jgi:hypothetical protein